jgi:3-oxoacyl-[acyl-carrier-protein] synthase-1
VLNGEFSRFDCRNNRLANLGLAQDGFREDVESARQKYGAARIGVFIGTSTSGNNQLELAYRRRDPETGELPADFLYETTLNMYSAAQFTRHSMGLDGPTLAISTACSSSAKAFSTAYRYIEAGFCDAAVVGGVDSLCLTTLYGFNSLNLLAPNPCSPWDPNREGINLGEAAGFALVERPDPGDRGLALLGYGESSDAYHMTAPHPEGLGAMISMKDALSRAKAKPGDVSYVNLHGTATLSNDALEDKAVVEVFGTGTPCSSTKGWTGHALGAAGISESIINFLAMENDFMPKSLNTREVDSNLHANILLNEKEGPVDLTMNNSFGFGGNNCSLLFGKLN